MIRDYVQFAIKNLIKRKLRTWLTTLGIIIGIATIVSLMVIGQGMENAIEETFQKLGISSIRVVPEGLAGPPTAEMGLDRKDAEFIEGIIGVDYVDQVLLNYANVDFGTETQFIETVSFDTSIGSKGLGDLDLKPIEGRLFELNEVGTITVGNTVAKKLFDKEMFARNSVKINDKKFRVIGVFEKTGTDIDNRIMMPLETARDLFDKPNIVNVIVVKAQDGIDLNTLAERIEEKLERKRGDDDFKVYTPEKLIAQVQGIFAAVSVVLVAIAAISLLVGGIGIMNSMFTAVLERTKEIGIMKAIGATNGIILFNFLIESSTMGLIGGVIGTIIGYAIGLGIGLIAKLTGTVTLSIRFEPQIIILALIIAVVIGTVSGMIPAIRAAKLHPVDALRYE
jgi:putative ABC transport system permease protein